MAAFVAPLPRVHSASLRLKIGLVPREAQHSLVQSGQAGPIWEKSSETSRLQQPRMTPGCLPTSNLGAAALLFVCLLVVYFPSQRSSHGPEESLLNLGEMTGWHLGTLELHLLNLLGVLEYRH